MAFVNRARGADFSLHWRLAREILAAREGAEKWVVEIAAVGKELLLLCRTVVEYLLEVRLVQRLVDCVAQP